MASTFVVMFSFLSIIVLCINSTHAHPLDSLNPSEINEISLIINGSEFGSSKNLSFHYIGLNEPSKEAVLSWQSNSKKQPPQPPPPREAFVIARASQQTYEITVSLTTRSIVSHRLYTGSGFPLLTTGELIAAIVLTRRYPKFLESIKKRELDIGEVDLGVFTVGWFGERGDKGRRRVVKMHGYYKKGSPSTTLRPIEGIVILVDVDKNEIVKYRDYRVVPVPKAEGTDYRASKQKPPFAAEIKPITVVQPRGPSFKINGQEIRLVINENGKKKKKNRTQKRGGCMAGAVCPGP